MENEDLKDKVTHPNVLRIQTVLTPCRCNAAIEIRSRTTHVQLILIGLGGYIISHLGASEQELVE